ncbi:Phosphoserine phosphatase [Candidatus Syntrophocurvum alkaliphilum]|uniref:Phosphoserine phosphatase n=1 Tax=Candidatus Syntrophocurvum alkaliphilum TaxID=2293317 RepID=A0A6I6DG13_9FIRM|nr:HAD family hydrolase [Candidatus Syntrophocurvum alkaliphilum]QGT99360.1 Phosphoserine phosphatase [Candidatus Syntrophocurvum alkaliphilum]
MKLAIFDFDGTLFTKDTLPCLGKEWLRQNRSKTRYIKIFLSIIPYVILYKLGVLDRDKMKISALKRFDQLFKGMTKKEIKTFFSKAYPHMRKLFNPNVVEEIKLAQNEGYHCVLLSGAYADLLNLVAKDLKIDSVIAVEITYNNDVFDHERDVPFINGESKLVLLKKLFLNHNIDWQSSRSYADSYSDLPVMKIVGQPVIVNPDEDLRTYGQKHNWRTIGA